MCVGQRIKSFLHATGRTQAWLSKETGIPTSRLSLSLAGKRKMTLDDYALICGALEVDTNKFIVPKRKSDTRTA